jgi:hypothetical protein
VATIEALIPGGVGIRSTACVVPLEFDPQLPRRLVAVERPGLDDPRASADDAEDPIERALGRRACHL